MVFSIGKFRRNLHRMWENVRTKNNAWSQDARPLGCIDALLGIDRMLSVRELSVSIGISIQQLYALADRNAIPHYRIGRAVRFDPAEIAEWLRAHSCGRRG